MSSASDPASAPSELIDPAQLERAEQAVRAATYEGRDPQHLVTAVVDADGLVVRIGFGRTVGSHAPEAVTGLVDLIVLGGPTHAFSLSRPSTRADAVRQGAPAGREEVGLREWLHGLRRGPHSELVATFDTRVERVRHLPGSAAKKAAKLAHSLGYTPVAHESFYVADVAGPLLPGELERAREWGQSLAADLRARHAGRSQTRSL